MITFAHGNAGDVMSDLFCEGLRPVLWKTPSNVPTMVTPMAGRAIPIPELIALKGRKTVLSGLSFWSLIVPSIG